MPWTWKDELSAIGLCIFMELALLGISGAAIWGIAWLLGH